MSSWLRLSLNRFQKTHGTPSARGLAHSKTLARAREAASEREASGSAAALCCFAFGGLTQNATYDDSPQIIRGNSICVGAMNNRNSRAPGSALHHAKSASRGRAASGNRTKSPPTNSVPHRMRPIALPGRRFSRTTISRQVGCLIWRQNRVATVRIFDSPYLVARRYQPLFRSVSVSPADL